MRVLYRVLQLHHRKVFPFLQKDVAAIEASVEARNVNKRTELMIHFSPLQHPKTEKPPTEEEERERSVVEAEIHEGNNAKGEFRNIHRREIDAHDLVCFYPTHLPILLLPLSYSFQSIQTIFSSTSKHANQPISLPSNQNTRNLSPATQKTLPSAAHNPTSRRTVGQRETHQLRSRETSTTLSTPSMQITSST